MSSSRLEFRTDPWTCASRIKRILPDPFCHKLIDGALRVIEDRENPIRLNLFSAAIRELLTHVLHELAPDAGVRKCTWYKPEPKTTGPTRKQRATYLVRGGLPARPFGPFANTNIADGIEKLQSLMKELNKLTHVRPGTVNEEQSQIEQFASEAFQAFDDLFLTVKVTRDLVANA